MPTILDDLGKRLTEAGKTTVQKTKEITDLAKLNSQISAEERSQESLFSQLGKEYFNQHAQDAEPVLSQTVNDINASMERVRELHKQINSIRGVRACEDCGAEAPLGAIFCPACGVKLPEYVAPEGEPVGPARCAGCGRELKITDQFCPTCGAKIEREEMETVENPEVISKPAQDDASGASAQDTPTDAMGD